MKRDIGSWSSQCLARGSLKWLMARSPAPCQALMVHPADFPVWRLFFLCHWWHVLYIDALTLHGVGERLAQFQLRVERPRFVG